MKVTTINKTAKLTENFTDAQTSNPSQETRLNSAQKKDAPIVRSAIKLSTNTTEAEKSSGIYTAGSSTKKLAFFDADLTTAEIKSLESHKASPYSQTEQLKSPIHFIHSPPPGITPTRYQTKTYGTDVYL